jgi:Holliday junction resolvase RusA-like endonuclease
MVADYGGAMNDLADELLGPLPTRKAIPVPGPIHFTILGEAVSKANSREAVFFGKGDSRRMAWIKSKKALTFERDALRQIPPRARVRFQGPVRVTLTIWYASERPDLDESLVLDCLQDRYGTQNGPDEDVHKRILVQHGVIRNDRQVREKHVYHAIDRANPRVDITVEPLAPQTIPLELE